MLKTDARYDAYIRILKEELVPAMGCTEPIAISYASARCRDLLGEMPLRCEIGVSGNIIKNVKSVVVPNAGGLKGIETALAAGVVAGDADKVLEVISVVTDAQKEEIRRFLKEVPISVFPVEDGELLDIRVTLHSAEHTAMVRIAGY
ncbi:MAG: serine dehydratase subunit alpha family protein, partial [Clostridia bacterium]|nr:serine dehydratase subunit alpha family protein [Clostridia bacterium]